MYQNDPMKVLTGECRLSYCNLTTPRAAQQGGEPKYSVTLLIPKTDVATKADIDAAIQAAANEALSKVWNGARPPQLSVPSWDVHWSIPPPPRTSPRWWASTTSTVSWPPLTFTAGCMPVSPSAFSATPTAAIRASAAAWAMS